MLLGFNQGFKLRHVTYTQLRDQRMCGKKDARCTESTTGSGIKDKSDFAPADAFNNQCIVSADCDRQVSSSSSGELRRTHDSQTHQIIAALPARQHDAKARHGAGWIPVRAASTHGSDTV